MKTLSAWARARSRRRQTVDSASERTASKDRADSVSTNGHPVSAASPSLRPVPSIPPHFLPRSSHDGSTSIRSGSNSRIIKPVLIGVSRPSDTFSRPETAGSIQSAVNWAADRVAQSPPRSPPSTAHSRTQSARHVDILSVTRPGVPFPLYSEDVARRNSEAASRHHNHTSRYQEEVATRNAAPPLTRAASDETKHVPNLARPRPHAPPHEVHDNDNNSSDADVHKVDETEAAAQDASQSRGVKDKTDIRYVKAAAPPSLDDIMSTTRTIPANAGLPQQPAKLPNASVEEDKTRAAGDAQLSEFSPAKMDGIDAAKVSAHQNGASELTQPHSVSAVSTAQSSTGVAPPRSRERVPSSSSTACPPVQQTANLPAPNTPLIDSAADDDSDALSDGSFTSASPGLWDDSKPQQRTSIAAAAAATRDSEQSWPVQSSGYIHYSGTSYVTPRHATPVQAEQVSPSSFSSIKILASLLPAVQEQQHQQQQEEQQQEEEHQETQPVQEESIGISSLGNEGRKTTSSRLYTVAETEPEPEVERGTAPLVDRPPVVPPPVRTVPPAEALQLSSESAESTPTQAKPPPESQWPTDLSDPNSPYAIRTRDFALTPRQETVASEEASPSRRDGQARSPVTPAKSKAARVSVFNEEAFLRKQEQARAALIKLQYSLNEDFEDAPLQAMSTTQAPTNGVNRYSNSSSSTDGKPHAPPPTQSLGQVLGYQRSGASQANGPFPRTSLSISDPPTSPRSISSISSSTRPIQRHSPMHSVQETTMPRAPSRKRGETSPHISEMRRLVYEMTQARPAMPMPSLPGHAKGYEASLRSFSLNPEEVSLSSFPLPIPRAKHEPQSQPQEPVQEELDEDALSYSPFPQPLPLPHRQAQPYTFEGPDELDAAPSPVIRTYSASPSRSRHSQKSTTRKSGHSKTPSNASQHSIPTHLIPDRGSSMRDASVADDEI